MFFVIMFSQKLEAEANGLEGVLNVIKYMTKMRAFPDFRMICNLILPWFDGKPLNNTISQLRGADLPYNIVVDAVLLRSLLKEDLKGAARFAQSHNKYTFSFE